MGSYDLLLDTVWPQRSYKVIKYHFHSKIILAHFFHEIIYDLISHFCFMVKFCDFFTLRPSDLITSVTYDLMDIFCPCFLNLVNYGICIKCNFNVFILFFVWLAITYLCKFVKTTTKLRWIKQSFIFRIFNQMNVIQHFYHPFSICQYSVISPNLMYLIDF